MSKSILKPCAFCGDKALIDVKVVPDYFNEIYRIRCFFCKILTPWDSDLQKLQERWNIRI